MPTQKQYNTTLQRVRQIDCKIAVLDKDYTLIDEISGQTTSISINISADSDIRRTADINMNLKDDVSKAQNSMYYWTAGNIYWFDKYVQIYTSIKDISDGEFVWVNQGIYCINTPSINYDAISNTLSFQAVDLVAKMTGMRNGQIQGSTTTIAADMSINNAIETILLEQGFSNYILYEPPQTRTVEEINIDAGGTAWDLLTQLRDINSNWEMFFDVDGVFHFQQIPSGKVIVGETTEDDTTEYIYGEPTPLVDDDIWDKVLISASYETNFEDVKNYIEVYGKSHEPSEVGEAVQPPYTNYINVTLNKSRENYVNGHWTIAFGIGDLTEVNPEILAYPIYYIYIYDNSDETEPWLMLSISSEPIVESNEMYCFKLHVGAVPATVYGEYLGYIQPMAYAFENNPQSPFYVGQFSKYYCKLNYNEVDFASIKESTISNTDAIISGSSAIIDIRPWISADDYTSANSGDEWKLKVHCDLDNDAPISYIAVRYAGTTITTGIYGASRQQISLDYSQDYMIIITKGNSNTPSANDITILYYPTEASSLSMSGTTQINLPIFNNQIRCVCAGGEYDNIYSNDLAEQRARYEVYLRSRLHDSISITCVPIYWLDVNQIISYKLPNSESVNDDYWIIKSISTNISVDGTQTINAIRYYPLYP